MLDSDGTLDGTTLAAWVGPLGLEATGAAIATTVGLPPDRNIKKPAITRAAPIALPAPIMAGIFQPMPWPRDGEGCVSRGNCWRVTALPSALGVRWVVRVLCATSGPDGAAAFAAGLFVESRGVCVFLAAGGRCTGAVTVDTGSMRNAVLQPGHATCRPINSGFLTVIRPWQPGQRTVYGVKAGPPSGTDPDIPSPPHKKSDRKQGSAAESSPARCEV